MRLACYRRGGLMRRVFLTACGCILAACSSESAADDSDWASPERNVWSHVRQFQPRCHHTAEAESLIFQDCQRGSAKACENYVDLNRAGFLSVIELPVDRQKGIDERNQKVSSVLIQNCGPQKPDFTGYCSTYIALFPNDSAM